MKGVYSSINKCLPDFFEHLKSYNFNIDNGEEGLKEITLKDTKTKNNVFIKLIDTIIKIKDKFKENKIIISKK